MLARGARLSLLLVIAALATSAFAASAAAEVVVGQLAPGVAPPVTCDHEDTYDELQASIADGNGYAVPVGGVLTSWSTNAAAGDGQTQGFKVFRPTGPDTYMVVAEDAPRALAPGIVNTFPVNIPVQAGDVIGIVYVAKTQTGCAFLTGEAGDELVYKEPTTPVGGSIEFTSSETERRINIAATVLPPPVVSGIAPTHGSVKGASVVISGLNFAHVASVSFGSVPATSVVVNSENQITVTAPPSATRGSVPVTVTTVAGAAAAAQPFKYEGCLVPKKLNGKKLKPAKRKLRKADCRVGKIKKRGDATAKTGKVVKVRPKPGRLLAPGAKVNLVLAA